jgi:hypothetical protein
MTKKYEPSVEKDENAKEESSKKVVSKGLKLGKKKEQEEY